MEFELTGANYWTTNDRIRYYSKMPHNALNMTQQSGDKEASALVTVKCVRKEAKSENTVECNANLQRLNAVILLELLCIIVGCIHISHVKEYYGL